MSNILHGKRTTIESFYEGELRSTKHEMEVSQFSTRNDLLKDIIDALSVINKGETKKLTVEVCIDEKGRYRLVKKWLVT